VPVRFGLELAVRSRRAWIAIIDKRDIVPNENAFFDCDAFADEGVAGNFATRPDLCAFLDFNESANFRFVTDLASVKVYKPTDPNIASELYVGRYKLMSNAFSSHALMIPPGGTTRGICGGWENARRSGADDKVIGGAVGPEPDIPDTLAQARDQPSPDRCSKEVGNKGL
jgi:hypothetical protein